MFLTGLLDQFVLRTDMIFSRAQIYLAEQRNGLITLFLHNLFLDEREIAQNLAYPQQCFTLDHLKLTIEYFQSAGYRFVSPSDIVQGSDLNGPRVLLSFDDGYFNNRRALPLMEAYDVPAVFFVPAQMIQEQKAYWWDVLYRARLRKGISRQVANSEIVSRCGPRADEIEFQIMTELGISRLEAESDVDRLFTPEELCVFATHPLVSIGNHGCHHEFLTAYSAGEVLDILSQAQRVLQEITGKTPLAVAYPNGSHSPGIVRSSREAGLKLGFTTAARKSYPNDVVSIERRMHLGRFTLWGGREIPAQCQFTRSDLLWHARYRQLIEGLKRGRG